MVTSCKLITSGGGIKDFAQSQYGCRRSSAAFRQQQTLMMYCSAIRLAYFCMIC